MLSDDAIRELRTLRGAISVVLAGSDDTEEVNKSDAADVDVSVQPAVPVRPGEWPARLHQLTLIPAKGGPVNAYFYSATEAEAVRQWLEAARWRR